MKRFLLVVVLALAPVLALLAQPKQTITFDYCEYDLGTMQVSKTPYTVKFPFTNTGLLPLQIRVVSTPCVCTTSDWTKEEIEPGGTGEVIVTYKAGAPSEKMRFTFFVYSNGIPNPIGLRIKGKVVGEPLKKRSK